MEQFTDAQLTADAACGNNAAVAELYRRHHPEMVRYARSLTRCHATAEDIAAEAFVKTLVRIRAGVVVTSFRAYTYAAVRHLFVDQCRRKPEVDRILDLHPRVSDEVTTPDPAPAIVNTLVLDAMLDALHPAHQHVLRLAIVEGYSNSEIAEHIGRGADATASLTYRARVALRQVHSGT